MMEAILLGTAGLAAVLFFVFKPSKKTGSLDARTKIMPAKISVNFNNLIGSSSIIREVQSSTIPKTSGTSRAASAKLIFKEFKRAGYSDSISLAAVINANYESRLSNRAVGDSGKSVGLFQVHDVHGMSKVERMNPILNIKFILSDMKKNGSRIVSEAARGASVAKLSGYFGHDIERPKDRSGALVKRAVYAQELFPTIADLSARDFSIKM